MNFLKNTWKPKKIVVLLLELQADGIHLFAQKKSIGKSLNEDEFIPFDSIKDLVGKFGKEHPYFIHVQGSGILTRLVDLMPNYKEQLIVNGDKDDFYFCSFQDSYRVAISFFRKSLIQEELERLKEEKAFLLNITCGSIPCFLLLGENGKLSTDFVLETKDARIAQLTRNDTGVKPEERIQFEAGFYHKNNLLAEGICRSVSSENGFEGGIIDEQKELASNEYVQYSKFRFFGISAVFFILFALMVNYFYLNYLNNQNAELELELSLNNENISLLDRLKQEKTRKEQLVVSSGINSSAFLSFYLDEIGKTVPASIRLTEMYVFPLTEKLKQKLKVEIDQQLIEISGVTSSSEVLDDWLERINRYEWVDRVELISYLKLDSSKGEFKLIIGLKQ